MVCPACVVIPVAAVGLSLTAGDQYYLGLLLTVWALCVYLHYKDFKQCDQCV
jgi:hypothetical protein